MWIVRAVKSASKQVSSWFESINAGRVETAPRAQALPPPVKLNWRDPAPAALQSAIWVGAKALARPMALGKATFAVLTEASADVGEMFIRRHGGEA